MKISDYEFGRITIDGTSYTSDVIMTPDRVIDGWWRKQGHSLQIEDLADILPVKPEVLIVGTGYYGRMQVADDTRRFLAEKGIELKEADTAHAVAVYNELQKEYARIVAALHLTC